MQTAIITHRCLLCPPGSPAPGRTRSWHRTHTWRTNHHPHHKRLKFTQEALSLRDSATQNALSTEYNAQAVGNFFTLRPWLVVSRLLGVAVQFSVLYTQLKFSAKGNKMLPEEICKLLSSLGPTFVKLGQTLSTREDLVGKEMTRALADLQMSAPPFPDSVAAELIEYELGGKPTDVFDTFSQQHVAAASLGQVYKATLRSSGEHVAVKVQRPDLLGSIALDIYVLRLGLGLVRSLAKINSDIRNIADEVGTGLFAELDYRVEARQADLFSRAHAHLPYVDAVTSFPQFSSKRVLTTRWIEGHNPNDLLLQCEAQEEGSEEHQRLRARLVRMVNLGIESSLTQLLLTGILHGDPHPGNLILTEDDKLVYLDFGLITLVPPETREAMMGCLIHVALGKWRSMADDLDRMGFLKAKIDKDELAEALAVEVTQVWPLAGSFGANSFLPDGSAQAGGALAARLEDGSVRPELGLGQGLTFGKLSKAIIKLAIQFRFRLPPYYTLIVRSLCSLEGIALRVDPEFSIVNAAIPIILRRMLTDTRPGAVALLRELLLEDDKRLRIGMLEGLLRNYSVEAGAGTVSKTAASGVVLKHSKRSEFSGNGSGTSSVVEQRNGAGKESMSHATTSHIAKNGAFGESTSNGSTPANTVQRERSVHHASVSHVHGELKQYGEGFQDASSPGARSQQAQAVLNGSNGSVAASVPQRTEAAEVSSSTHGPSTDDASDLIGSVVQMTLSAQSAGVRRVVLESSMKDIFKTMASKDGKSLRLQVIDLLAQVVTWRKLTQLLKIFITVSVVGAFKMLFQIGKRKSRIPRLTNIYGGLNVMNIHLGRVPLKRLQLGVLMAFGRLWRESKMSAIFSLFLIGKLGIAALFKRRAHA